MTARSPLRVGIVGCGEITQLTHLPILNELATVTVAGLCDLSDETLHYLAERWGIGFTTTDYTALVASDQVDAVVICTYDHAPVAAAAIAAGKHVLIEKPLAFTPDEARALESAAQAAGVVAQVGYMKLFDPAVLAARERMQRIASPLSISCHNFAGSFAMHGPLYTQHRAADVPAEALAAGRAAVSARIAAMLGPDHAGYTDLYTLLLMLGSHDLSVLRYLFGSPERVSYASARGDAQLLAVLDYPDAVPCVLEIGVGTSYRWWDEWVALSGADELVRLEFAHPYVRYDASRLRIRETLDGAASDRVVEVSHDDPFRLEWVGFADLIVNGGQVRSTLAGAVADIELARDIILAMAPRPLGASA